MSDEKTQRLNVSTILSDIRVSNVRETQFGFAEMIGIEPAVYVSVEDTRGSRSRMAIVVEAALMRLDPTHITPYYKDRLESLLLSLRESDVNSHPSSYEVPLTEVDINFVPLSGGHIRAARVVLKLTQLDMARFLGLRTAMSVSNWENPKRPETMPAKYRPKVVAAVLFTLKERGKDITQDTILTYLEGIDISTQFTKIR